MTDNSVDPRDVPDQDAEPTMTAPAEGRPDGTVADPDGIGHDSVHASDADDQMGSEDPTV
jgi:hypothetical protein